MRAMPAPFPHQELEHPAGRGRRAFCCAAAASIACCLPGLKAQAAALGTGKPLALDEVAPGLFVSQGVHEDASRANLNAIANVGFVVGDNGVAVIDSGGCRLWGERLRQAVRSVTDKPITHVVQTHVHPDHVLGSAAFLADEPIFLGHAKLARALVARGGFYIERLTETLGGLAEGTVVVPPTRLVTDRLEIDLGGRVLRVEAWPTAHTDNDLTVLDLASGTLWASDLLFMERTPVMDGSLNGWLEVMAAMAEIPAERVVPGHGPTAAPWPDALAAQRRYLTLLRDEIRAIIAANGTMEQAVETVALDERANWVLFDDYNPRNVVASFAELEWE